MITFKTYQRPLIMFFGLLLVFWFHWSGLAYGDMEWTIKTQVNLSGPPLDVSESADGKWLFILIPGEVVIYSIDEERVEKRIPVDKGFDSLTHSPRHNTLILTSHSAKAVQVIQLEMVHEIDISGLPFKGQNNAPVTIAVFSDYQ